MVLLNPSRTGYSCTKTLEENKIAYTYHHICEVRLFGYMIVKSLYILRSTIKVNCIRFLISFYQFTYFSPGCKSFVDGVVSTVRSVQHCHVVSPRNKHVLYTTFSHYKHNYTGHQPNIIMVTNLHLIIWRSFTELHQVASSSFLVNDHTSHKPSNGTAMSIYYHPL